MRNGFTRFLRVWLAALIAVSFAGSALVKVVDADHRFDTVASVAGEVAFMGCAFMLPLAVPMLFITFAGWVVCGGIQK